MCSNFPSILTFLHGYLTLFRFVSSQTLRQQYIYKIQTKALGFLVLSSSWPLCYKLFQTKLWIICFSVSPSPINWLKLTPKIINKFSAKSSVVVKSTLVYVSPVSRGMAAASLKYTSRGSMVFIRILVSSYWPGCPAVPMPLFIPEMFPYDAYFLKTDFMF